MAERAESLLGLGIGNAQQGIWERLPAALLITDAITVDARGMRQITIIGGDGTPSTGILTFAGNAANTNTVTIDTKVYTFLTVIGASDGDVLIGAAATDSIDNLIAAITLGAGGGTLYAAATTLHPTVTAAAGAADTMDASAKVGGVSGDSIDTTETLVSGSWGAVTLENGIDSVTTVSRVDLPSATTHTTGTENSFTVGTLTRTVTVVDWPFYRVSVADGPSRVALV